MPSPRSWLGLLLLGSSAIVGQANTLSGVVAMERFPGSTSGVDVRGSLHVLTVEPTCMDHPGWVDSDGYQCEDYRAEELCTPSGGYGYGWNPYWRYFSDWAPVGADKACCACGGGTRGAPIPAAIHLYGELAGLPPNATGAVRLHMGSNCSAAGAAYTTTEWSTANYTTRADGGSIINITAPLNYTSAAGKALIISTPNGTRVSCGIVSTCPGYPGPACGGSGDCVSSGGSDRPMARCACKNPARTGADCSQCQYGWKGFPVCLEPTVNGIAVLGRYPAYPASGLNITGEIHAAQLSNGSHIGTLLFGRLSGAEPYATANIAIHTGTACDFVYQPGGPLMDGTTNHWIHTNYTTDSNGTTTDFRVSSNLNNSLFVGVDFNFSDVAGRVVVVKSSAGVPVACGPLVACPGATEGNTCNGHGSCVLSSGAPTCVCEGNWQGAGCLTCYPGYSGPNCEHKCPGVPASQGQVCPRNAVGWDSTCKDYEENQWCTAEGDIGPGWNPYWGLIEAHGNWSGGGLYSDGLNPYQACCACGRKVGPWDSCRASTGNGVCNTTDHTCTCTKPYFGEGCGETHVGIPAPDAMRGPKYLKFVSGPVITGTKVHLRMGGIRTSSSVPMEVRIAEYYGNCWGSNSGYPVDPSTDTATFIAPAAPGHYSLCAKWREDYELIEDANGLPQNLTVVAPTIAEPLSGYDNCEDYMTAMNLTEACGCYIETNVLSLRSPKVANTFLVGDYSITTQPSLYSGCCSPDTAKQPATIDFGNGTQEVLFWGTCPRAMA